jgi:hypothetical protein
MPNRKRQVGAMAGAESRLARRLAAPVGNALADKPPVAPVARGPPKTQVALQC